jgi:serine/threonine-protein kinase
VPEPVEAILMKALEKDPDQRYQSAWEMQFELDRFLANNEFTPSNNHLATFIRQLFKEEIEEERSRLVGTGVLPSAVGLSGSRFDALDVDALASGAAGSGPRYLAEPPPAESTAPQRPRPGNLALDLLPEEETRLRSIAAKMGMTPEDLAREMLRGHLKFH